MEGIHGVDVSWLHHSPKDHYSSKNPSGNETSIEEPVSLNNDGYNKEDPVSIPQKVNGITPPHTLGHIHRPHLGSRAHSEKVESPGPSAPRPTKDPKGGQGLGRRNSWMSSISSKFSSSANPAFVGTGPKSPASATSPPISPKPNVNSSYATAGGSNGQDVKKADPPAANVVSTSPKTGHTFIQSALRRLSSSGGTSMGKATPGSAGAYARKTMNVDPYRQRCSIPELDLQKLRRVAFCVDVEIAGAAQYVDDVEAPPAPTLEGKPNLTRLEHEAAAKKKLKDQKLKKGEGAALKSGIVGTEEKEKDSVTKVSIEESKTPKPTESDSLEQGESKEITRKKEKKKRSEGERKERKERKHQEALASGSIPIELKREASGSMNSSSTGSDTPPNSQDKPTTDPLRIYRRCCQLRETPILKRIAEQISVPSACHATTPGTLSCLDLSGYWMQLPDLVTLGDYLAVVPVKKLILENCGLGDEAVRVILAGLLAAKTPEQAKYNRRLGRKRSASTQTKDATEQLGVVEKVSLKNNPKVGKEGWRHIALFINMSTSLKAIDLSEIPFPQASATVHGSKSHAAHHSHAPTTTQVDMPTVMQEAIGERLGVSRLEELVMADCGLNTECIEKVIDGVIKSGCTRLGLASNNMTREGLKHVMRYVQSGKCEGLDLGGNDLREDLDMLVDVLNEAHPLWALSLADCHLSPSSLENLLPALVKLPNCRFLDLSHNRDLFSTRPTVLNLIRKHLPQFDNLKRLHLMDVAMTPEHAIALAEVLPESRSLAHLNILDNHLLSPLASAKTEAAQEEACALYASLMAAVRVSDSIICIDIDVPSRDSSEVVKALAKQVVAYSLRNLEQIPLAENPDSAIAAMTDPHGGKQLTVPDVLLHLVGHVDEYPENHDNDEPAPDDDYIVGGTGVVKALDICLNRAADGRKGSRDESPLQSGTATPKTLIQGQDMSKGKAKEMSKNLLESARKIRARLQPALIKELKAGNDMSYRRLHFLDTTLERMIQRFEDEYPETRLPKPVAQRSAIDPDIVSDRTSTSTGSSPGTATVYSNPTTISDGVGSDPTSPYRDEDTNAPLIRPESLSRHASSPSLASRQAQEEGRMHRLGHRIKRDILRPETLDYAHGTTGTEVEAEYLQDLRRRLENYEGREIKDLVERLGPEAVFDVIGATAVELAAFEKSDPEGFSRFKEARRDMLTLYADQNRPGPVPDPALSDGL